MARTATTDAVIALAVGTILEPKSLSIDGQTQYVNALLLLLLSSTLPVEKRAEAEYALCGSPVSNLGFWEI